MSFLTIFRIEVAVDVGLRPDVKLSGEMIKDQCELKQGHDLWLLSSPHPLRDASLREAPSGTV